MRTFQHWCPETHDGLFTACQEQQQHSGTTKPPMQLLPFLIAMWTIIENLEHFALPLSNTWGKQSLQCRTNTVSSQGGIHTGWQEIPHIPAIATKSLLSTECRYWVTILHLSIVLSRACSLGFGGLPHVVQFEKS